MKKVIFMLRCHFGRRQTYKLHRRKSEVTFRGKSSSLSRGLKSFGSANVASFKMKSIKLFTNTCSFSLTNCAPVPQFKYFPPFSHSPSRHFRRFRRWEFISANRCCFAEAFPMKAHFSFTKKHQKENFNPRKKILWGFFPFAIDYSHFLLSPSRSLANSTLSLHWHSPTFLSPLGCLKIINSSLLVSHWTERQLVPPRRIVLAFIFHESSRTQWHRGEGAKGIVYGYAVAINQSIMRRKTVHIEKWINHHHA